MPKVAFMPQGITVDAEPNETLLQLAIRTGVTIPTTCGGKASCRLCIVRVPKGQEHALSDMEFLEQSAMGNVFFITRERLSCQTRVKSDVTVEIPEMQVPVKKKPFSPNRPFKK